MSYDVPVMDIASKKKNKEFLKKNKDDIQATMDFLYKRGMWSKFHYEQWTNMLKECESSELLHLWWDSIVGGAMFEMESPKMEMIEEAMEGMGEVAEEVGEEKAMSFFNSKKKKTKMGKMPTKRKE